VPITFFIAAAAVALPFARAYARRIEQGGKAMHLPTEVGERLERMEQAIDAIAVEVERISEGQRFATKLLSDANSAGSLPRGRLDT
ncbi:MAG TPA: hypothetical protein VMM77_11775, partial [Gemmatimonadaceae bacterium]|nr:hypothetical protein [Gemmatimonadaceae bacterium]